MPAWKPLGAIYIMTEFPKYNSSSQKGDDGVSILTGIVRKNLKWIVRKNHQEVDFGIDVYLDVVTETNSVTGKSIAAQVKTGPSYFSESTSFGWVYRDKLSHLNYYLNHDIPVIIILVNDQTGKAYWCYCDPLKTGRSGDTWTITIPFNSELTSNSKEELLKHVSPVKDYVSQLDNFWKLNKELKESERLVFIIDKSDVEKNSYKEIIAGLDRIQVNHEIMENLQGRVDILIHGYNDDPRELPEIPEVKKWAQKIFESTNGLSYFLVIGENSNFFKLLKMCYMKYKRIPNSEFVKNGNLQYMVELDLTDTTFLSLAFNDLNEFTEKYNLSEEINKNISYKIGEAVIGKKAPRK